MSVKRPSRRYIGFRYEPPSAPRKTVGAAVERLIETAPRGAHAETKPKLLVCHEGAGILVVPTPLANALRKAMEAGPSHGDALKMTSVVSSGTIATVKLRLKLSTRRKADTR